MGVVVCACCQMGFLLYSVPVQARAVTAKYAETGPVVGNRSGLHPRNERPRRYGGWPAADALASHRNAPERGFRGAIASNPR
ncbi:hypothetical protein CMEL01_16137 [Colletotrichum melonis]|uniref:Secreted protein n=1 Tax=Colletotrichum melonis TaxID=1209925 RepID=A0AAI9UEZ5_9PEZI|nr:hypothetical protein CMEL01_16137 [Colletotrichum melonis]